MADRRSHLIFISYRGSDQNWATELVYTSMKEAFGAAAVFKAGNSLRVGEEFPPTLRSEAASCPVMLACIGPGWLTATAPDGSRRLDSPADWVREEIAIALQSGNHLVPLLLGNRNEVEVPKPDLVPESIRAMVDRQALWLAPGRGLEATVSMLVDQLAELVPELAERRRDRSTAQPASAPQAPSGKDQAPAGAGATMTQRNDVAGNGLLIGAQDGSVHCDAAAQAPAGDGEAARPAAGKHLEQHTTVRDSGTAIVAQGGNVIMHRDPAAPPSSGAPQRPSGPADDSGGA